MVLVDSAAWDGVGIPSEVAAAAWELDSCTVAFPETEIQLYSSGWVSRSPLCPYSRKEPCLKVV